MPLPSPIRVLLAIPKMESGGSQRVMLNLLRNLDRSRFELHLALLDTEGPHFKDIPQDVSIHHLGVSSARFAVLPFAETLPQDPAASGVVNVGVYERGCHCCASLAA